MRIVFIDLTTRLALSSVLFFYDWNDVMLCIKVFNCTIQNPFYNVRNNCPKTKVEVTDI